MVFNSLLFVVFLAIVLLLYFRLPHRGQNGLLLLASYVFYGAWDWRFCSLLFISTTVDWWVGLHLDPQRSAAYRKRVLLLSCVFNLGFLALFKYYGFFMHSFVDLAAQFGWHPDVRILNIALPVGISFYTFQSMSYTIEVYRNHLRPAKSYLEYAAFVAFFPHMVAGPIMRATALLPQIQMPRVLTQAHVVEGLRLILWGSYKKMVIADNMALIADPIFARGGPFTFADVVVGVVAFAFQIYGDFSGYSDIARGVASLMGFQLMVNFDLPYLATSPQDFWRRWHISLSTWLRDFLYVSLGGNRRGEARTYLNLMLTMLLGGLWHGANWTFVAWGAYHGALLSMHRWIAPQWEAVRGERSLWRARLGWASSVAFMFCLTLYGWLLFRCHSFDQISQMTQALFTGPYEPRALLRLSTIAFYACPLVIIQLIQYAKDDLDVMRTAPLPSQVALYAFLLYSIFLFGAFDGATFIYFQF